MQKKRVNTRRSGSSNIYNKEKPSNKNTMEVTKFKALKRSNMRNGSLLDVCENTLIPKPLMPYKIPRCRIFSFFSKIHQFLFFNGTRTALSSDCRLDVSPYRANV